MDSNDDVTGMGNILLLQPQIWGEETFAGATRKPKYPSSGLLFSPILYQSPACLGALVGSQTTSQPVLARDMTDAEGTESAFTHPLSSM